MLKTYGIIYGLAFVLVGILGFVPAVSPNGMLLRIFHVNLVHNLIHLVTGGVALWMAFHSLYAIQQFFKIFGIIYGIVTVLGFIYGERDILGFIANNHADNWLHLIITAVSLYLGFAYKEEQTLT